MDLRGTHEPPRPAPARAATAAGATANPNKWSVARRAARAMASEAATDVARLGESAVYVCVVIGMTCYTAVIGAYAFYGPQAGRDVFGVPPQTADLAFGGITVVAGTLGTLGGGIALDAAGSTFRNGLLLCCAGLGAGGILHLAAFALTSTFLQFCLVLGLGEMAVFATQAPSNAVAMWSVPPGLRPLAISVSVVAMHVLGDVPSSPLLGLLQGSLQNWRVTMSIAAAGLGAGAAAYAVGVRAARTAMDYRAVEVAGSGSGGSEVGDGRAASPQDEPALDVEGNEHRPLLVE